MAFLGHWLVVSKETSKSGRFPDKQDFSPPACSEVAKYLWWWFCGFKALKTAASDFCSHWVGLNKLKGKVLTQPEKLECCQALNWTQPASPGWVQPYFQLLSGTHPSTHWESVAWLPVIAWSSDTLTNVNKLFSLNSSWTLKLVWITTYKLWIFTI